MKNTKYFIGLDVHKKKTTHVVRDRIGNIILEGEVPSPLTPPRGCSFHPRCFMAVPECSRLTPHLRQIGRDHQVACLRVSDP